MDGLDLSLPDRQPQSRRPSRLLIALAVRFTSPGPMLFCQRRLGKDGVPFTLYKFRSMFVNAPDIRNPDGSAFNAEDDPRVTQVGRLLRKTSLDELPQLINVLKGDMSLVGPRPDQVDQYQYYTAEEKRKLRMKPGITGPWQTGKRSDTEDYSERVELDCWYVLNNSPWVDIKIIFKTVWSMLRRKGAY